MWIPIDGRGLSLTELQHHIDLIEWRPWRPSGMVLHNTAEPNLSQWNDTNAAQRIKNLEFYFRNERGWPSGPHAFVDDHKIWLFTPFNQKGTHSPSWNGTKLGIEMVGDFSKGHDDDDSGRGLAVKNNAAALFGMIHTRLGIDPETIKLHKEDTKTTHDCPGADVEKSDFISRVQEWMGHGGEHTGEPLPIEKISDAKPNIRIAIISSPDGFVNVREMSSAASKARSQFSNGAKVQIIGDAMNGNTRWLRLADNQGWIAARLTNFGN